MSYLISRQLAMEILDNHSINHRVVGDTLMVEQVDSVCRDGHNWVAESVWIPCPLVRRDLMTWLGY